VEAGPDVGRLPNEGAFGADMAAEANTEGGPLEDIHFDLNSSALGDAARETLGQHANWLKAHAGVRVTVEGHCDERGTVEYNQALGERRAMAARDYLAGAGISAGRLNVISYGKERPFAPGSDEASWAQNRRAHFVAR
jgi:peptidoglycan-associated lipoprotein